MRIDQHMPEAQRQLPVTNSQLSFRLHGGASGLTEANHWQTGTVIGGNRRIGGSVGSMRHLAIRRIGITACHPEPPASNAGESRKVRCLPLPDAQHPSLFQIGALPRIGLQHRRINRQSVADKVSKVIRGAPGFRPGDYSSHCGWPPMANRHHRLNTTSTFLQLQKRFFLVHSKHQAVGLRRRRRQQGCSDPACRRA